MKRKTLTLLYLAVPMILLGAVPALAQNFQGLNTLQNFATEGQSAGKYVVNIVFVFSGIIGAIMLIPAAIKFFKGEQQSKDAITSVGLGLIAIFIILGLIKAVMAFT